MSPVTPENLRLLVDGLLHDHAQYPQLRLPDMQLRRVQQLSSLLARVDDLPGAPKLTARANGPIFCAHCETTVYHCPGCGKAEWRAGESPLTREQHEQRGTR